MQVSSSAWEGFRFITSLSSDRGVALRHWRKPKAGLLACSTRATGEGAGRRARIGDTLAIELCHIDTEGRLPWLNGF